MFSISYSAFSAIKIVLVDGPVPKEMGQVGETREKRVL